MEHVVETRLTLYCLLLLRIPLAHDNHGPQTGEDVHEVEGNRGTQFGVAWLVFLLLLTVISGCKIESANIHWLSEAGAGLLIGVGGGWALRWLVARGEVNHWEQHSIEQVANILQVARFDEQFFFFVLLPPIIFEAGYNMRRRKFFQNIGAICLLAFAPTLSAVVIGPSSGGLGCLPP